MKLAVIGSRSFSSYDLMCQEINKLRSTHQITHIVSGGANGADALAERYAKDFNLPIIVLQADWVRYGKRAGFIRNVQIWDQSDIGIAFWDGSSKGTAHSFKIAEQQNKQLTVIQYAIEKNK